MPATGIPDVVDLYIEWSMGLLGLDPLTPSLLAWMYRWLTEIETSREVKEFPYQRQPFGGEIARDRIGLLESSLRTGFLSFCNRVPALAVDYLRLLGKYKYKDEIVRSIMKFRGTLAQAAPEELAEFTADALISEQDLDDEKFRREYGRAFSFFDTQFYPASPAQGPFLELLTHAPEHGLSLIHKLVDHAILFHSRGQDYGTNAITISFPDGDRVFPWIQSYPWARDWGGSHGSVTSALMALEAWAHGRIEGGESIEKVLADVLGPSGSPAAYLLIAVDLMLSHWPKSREAVLPFITCPELLSIDRDRQTHDNFEIPDFFGIKAFEKEPVGAANLESLKKRASRRHMLDELLGDFALNGSDEQRNTLATMLRQAIERLGPPDEQSDLGDPRFMAVHALNSIDPKNWREVPVSMKDGMQGTAYEYVPPEAET